MTLANIASPLLSALVERISHCQCGQPIFFRNTVCLTCGAALGYEPESATLFALTPVHADDSGGEGGAAPNELWQRWYASGSGPADSMTPAHWRRCANLQTPAACNWLLPQEAPPGADAPAFCRACRLNRTIPSLDDPAHPDNGELWARIERSKRQLVSALIALKLPVASRVDEDPERGLMFDLLRGNRTQGSVLTGHEEGLITLNIEEADDAMREAARLAMREPYRTLLGHFRHEVGHYYWDRLIENTHWIDGFRALFGDESADYASALQRHYEQGARADWESWFISAYASAHPWEDFAECWAHYLHMRDTVDTALNFGLDIENPRVELAAFDAGVLYRPDDVDAERFLKFVNGWTRLTTLLNEMSRSMGQPDFYPFVLSGGLVAKLQFIHMVVSAAAATASGTGSQQNAPTGSTLAPA